MKFDKLRTTEVCEANWIKIAGRISNSTKPNLLNTFLVFSLKHYSLKINLLYTDQY